MLVTLLSCILVIRYVHAGRQASTAVNELANSCFFTYRLTFKLCPDQDSEAICNKHFGVNGAEFQHKMWKYYTEAGPPLLEEASWLINMFPTDEDKAETLRECPAILILSYLLIGIVKRSVVPKNIFSKRFS